jgi:hypothetical protein
MTAAGHAARDRLEPPIAGTGDFCENTVIR